MHPGENDPGGSDSAVVDGGGIYSCWEAHTHTLGVMLNYRGMCVRLNLTNFERKYHDEPSKKCI